jgi:hypothetical protein
MYDNAERMPIVDYIYGLGGSDVKLELMRQVIEDLGDIASGEVEPTVLTYLGTRKEA